MRKRSELRHTSLDNGFAPLFEPHQREATKRVLTGEARPGEFSGTRERLDRWPTVRKSVEENLTGIEENYTPFADALNLLRERMPPEDWAKLAADHLARVRELFCIDSFVAGVRSAMSIFENGLQAVGNGSMSIERLGRMHAEMVDAYEIS